MKATVEAGNAPERVTIELILDKVEDVGPALELVEGAARMMWPNLVLFTEQEPDVVIARPERKAKDFSKPPKPGSPSARVLEAAKRLGTVDITAIADECDMTNAVAAMAVANLRRGGHL